MKAVLVGAATVMVWLAAHLILRAGRNASQPEVVAHRGAAALAPENTLAAVRAGAQSGAAYLEVDVQRSADGVLVLLHDRSLERTSDGQGPVAMYKLGELRQLDAGSWFGARFAAESIPSLDQVAVELEDWPGTLVLEGKHPQQNPGLARDLASFAQQHPELSLAFVSFDHDWLRVVASLVPRATFGELSLYPLPLPKAQHVDRIGVHWLAPLLDPTLVFRAKRRGLAVWVWTVDRSWQLKLMSWLGVDAITSNRPVFAGQQLGN